MEISRKNAGDFYAPPAVDYGNPRNYGMNFTQLLFKLYLNQQDREQPKACVQATDSSGQGTKKTCQ